MSWRALRVKRGGRWGWNTVVRETVRGRAGAYAFRDSSGQVLYVGESRTGARSAADLRMWKTITRHFQDPTGKWADHYTKHVGGQPFRRAVANDLEIQVWLTSPGQAALDEQARLIARLKPAHNVDDGRADVDTSFDFGANVKANPGGDAFPWAAVDAKSGQERRLALQSFGGSEPITMKMVPGPHGGEPVVRDGVRIVYSSLDADLARWIVRALKVYRVLRHERGPSLSDLELARALPRRPSPAADAPYTAHGSGGSAWVGQAPVRVTGADRMIADGRTRSEAEALIAALRLADLGEAWRALGKGLTREAAAAAHDREPSRRLRDAYAELSGLLPPAPERRATIRTRRGQYAKECERCECPDGCACSADAPCECGTTKRPKAPTKRPKAPPKPEGYGEPSAHPGAAPGQTKLFNPERASSRAAQREYERKHWGHKARGVARSLEVVDPSHGSLVELGRLDRVEYVTSKKGDPARATYFHDFEGERPVLAFHVCARSRCPDRGKLVIAGGSYRVEDRGIVG